MSEFLSDCNLYNLRIAKLSLLWCDESQLLKTSYKLSLVDRLVVELTEALELMNLNIDTDLEVVKGSAPV